jgi:predicted ArsR family transcriptional regulator
VDRSHNEKVVENRLGDEDGSPNDPTSLAGAARAYVAHAEHEEAIKSLAKALNARFGPDTWDNIIKQQKQAIADAEKREKEAKLAAEERAERRQKYLIEFGKGLAVLAIAGGIGSFLYWAATSGPAVK